MSDYLEQLKEIPEMEHIQEDVCVEMDAFVKMRNERKREVKLGVCARGHMTREYS